MGSKNGACLNNCAMQLLVFADDTVLPNQAEEDLQCNIRQFSEAEKWHTLTIYTAKTTTMVFSRKQVNCNVAIEGQKLEM